MNLDAIGEELNRVLATETRGLGQHLREATPYLTASTFPVWRDIKSMLDANADHAQRLSQLLARLELTGRPASFDPSVAAYHYAELSFLLPLLIDEKRSQIAAYQRAVAHCGLDPRVTDVVTELQQLLCENQGQLDRLKSHHRKITGGTTLAQRE